MSKLQAIREQRKCKQTDLCRHLGARGYLLDVPLLSKMENGKCLPTPPMAEIICKLFGCNILDIYSPDEISFIKQEKTKKSAFGCGETKTEQKRHKIQFRHTELSLQVLTRENLALCGYKSQEEWFRAQVRELAMKVEKKSSDLAPANSAGEDIA